MWIRCEGNCLQLLGFWNFFVFFRFFPLKLVYFWTKSRKNTYGCFFHSFCATNLNFGTKNNGRMKSSILKTLIFYVFDHQFQIKPNRQNIFNAVFIELWPCLFTTKLSYTQLFKWGHSKRDSFTTQLVKIFMRLDPMCKMNLAHVELRNRFHFWKAENCLLVLRGARLSPSYW